MMTNEPIEAQAGPVVRPKTPESPKRPDGWIVLRYEHGGWYGGRLQEFQRDAEDILTRHRCYGVTSFIVHIPGEAE